jgi:hypothetical protein
VSRNRRILRHDACPASSVCRFVSNRFKSRRRLEIENLYLRHQLNIALRRTPRRLRLRGTDRALLVWMTGLQICSTCLAWFGQTRFCAGTEQGFERTGVGSLFAFIVVGHGRRQLLWFAVTRHPTAEWLAQQTVEAFPWDTEPTYLIRDNDGAYGRTFTNRLRAMGIRDRPISPRSPWQNAYVDMIFGRDRYCAGGETECDRNAIPTMRIAANPLFSQPSLRFRARCVPISEPRGQ